MSPEETLGRARRVPLYQEIAEHLRTMIERQAMQPGDRMPTERELAERLGVSRTSVRQGLTALQAVGVIDIRHGDGIYLLRPHGRMPELTDDLLSARGVLPRIMEVREALEVQIARLAALRRSDFDLQSLAAALGEMAMAIERGEDPVPADEHFHLALADAAGNALLVHLMRQIAEPIALTRRASLARAGRPPRSLSGHRRIYYAVERRDSSRAAAAMREHLRVVADIAEDDSEIAYEGASVGPTAR